MRNYEYQRLEQLVRGALSVMFDGHDIELKLERLGRCENYYAMCFTASDAGVINGKQYCGVCSLADDFSHYLFVMTHPIMEVCLLRPART